MHRRIGPVFVDAHPWAINRPRFRAGVDGVAGWAALDWGNGNSDPVLSLYVELRRPWAVRVAARFEDWRRERRRASS